MDHPLGRHQPRVPDRVIFEKLVQALVFGCAYWRIADDGCSATPLRCGRDEWVLYGVMKELEEIARDSYDRIIDFRVAFLNTIIVDRLIRKAWTHYHWESRPSRRP